MKVKTFRQLVRKVQEYKESIFGFKEVSLFFLNEKSKYIIILIILLNKANDLFTLTNIEVVD